MLHLYIFVIVAYLQILLGIMLPGFISYVCSLTMLSVYNYIMFNLAQYITSAIDTQISLARKLQGKIYLYDNCNHFKTGAIIIKNNVRYLLVDGDRAVLSSAAQEKFSKLFYKFMCSQEILEDDIGLYIIV